MLRDKFQNIYKFIKLPSTLAGEASTFFGDCPLTGDFSISENINFYIKFS